MPGSVQIAARPFEERTALRLAQAIERAAPLLGRPRGLEAARVNPV
jgi:Asp-tRNA(Asn)/Glu-tRNA(Gln) amidotransferase A subunit family amidase